ncbi:hypothetical protein QJS66_01985 [Kocuria rhizophila]|nr:hypothetical protein QJS66_01985 [Kocuria rhizophila]
MGRRSTASTPFWRGHPDITFELARRTTRTCTSPVRRGAHLRRASSWTT